MTCEKNQTIESKVFNITFNRLDKKRKKGW